MPASGDSGPCKEFAQTKIQLTESAGDEGALFGDAKNFLSKLRRIFDGGVAKQSGVQVGGCPGDARQRNVDSIRGCSGHHAENELGFSVLVRSAGADWRKSFAEFVLALLMSLQDLAGAFDHAVRQAGQPGNFDTVAFVSAAGLDTAQEND